MLQAEFPDRCVRVEPVMQDSGRRFLVWASRDEHAKAAVAYEFTSRQLESWTLKDLYEAARDAIVVAVAGPAPAQGPRAARSGGGGRRQVEDETS